MADRDQKGGLTLSIDNVSVDVAGLMLRIFNFAVYEREISCIGSIRY